MKKCPTGWQLYRHWCLTSVKVQRHLMNAGITDEKKLRQEADKDPELKHVFSRYQAHMANCRECLRYMNEAIEAINQNHHKEKACTTYPTRK